MTFWPALRIQLPTVDKELLNLVLVRLDDFQPTALLEHDAHDTHTLEAFFAAPAERDSASSALAAEFGNRGLSTSRTDVDDENWAARSQADLHAVQIGRIIVAPPWDLSHDVPPGIERIIIEPSMGFGTGHHASTRLCLEALQMIDIRGQHVLDVGTGSGLLAIAAARAGAGDVLAIDIDADALQSARENAARNGVDHVRFEVKDFRVGDLAPSDLVLANLTGALLQRTFDRMLDLAKPGGLLILGGFMQDDLIGRSNGIAATSPQAAIVDQHDEEGWRCVVLRRSTR